MNPPIPVIIKREYKPYYGYKKTNFSESNRYKELKDNTLEEITPVGPGRLCSIRQKFQIILGNIIVTHNKEKIVHPLFVFLLQRLVYYQCLNPQDKNELQFKLFNQLFKSMQKQEVLQETKDSYSRLYNDISKGIKQPNISSDISENYVQPLHPESFKQKFQQAQKKRKQHIQKMIKKKEQYIEWEKNKKKLQKLVQETVVKCIDKEKLQISQQDELTRLQKMKLYKQKIAQSQKNILPQLQTFMKDMHQDTISSQLQNLATSQQYLKYMIQNVNNIQVLRVDQQLQKIKLFADRNKNYFNTSILHDKQDTKNKPIPIQILANKTSKESTPVLQAISEFIQLLPTQIDYDNQSSQIIQDLFVQIIKYNQSTKAQSTLAFYQFLQPDNVAFDHLALAPKLLLQPILLDALGLRNKPCSLQNFLTFSPCPKQFKFFSSPQQLQSEIQLLLNDPFWSSTNFLKKVFNSKQKKQSPIFEQEKYQLYTTKQKICVWRFLLTSYYIKHRKAFGKPQIIVGDDHSKNHFKLQCTKIQKQLQKNMSKLSDFIGFQNKSASKKSFTFLLSQISMYYNSQNDDSLLNIAKYSKINKFLDIKRHLVACIINLFKNEKYWSRVYNVKKASFIFLLIANQILQISQILIRVFKNRFNDRKQFNHELQDNKSWKIFDRPLYSFLEDFFKKIQQYKNRNPRQDLQSKFLNRDDIGISLYKNITQLYKQISSLKKLEENLNFLDQSSEINQQQSPIHANYIQKQSEIIRVNFDKNQCLIRQLLYIELKNRSKDNNKQKNILLNEIIEKRTELILYSYLTLSEENLISYESLVIPLLKLTSSNSEDLFKLRPSKQQLVTEKQWLTLVQQYIKLQRLVPRQLRYLVKPQQTG